MCLRFRGERLNWGIMGKGGEREGPPLNLCPATPAVLKKRNKDGVPKPNVSPGMCAACRQQRRLSELARLIRHARGRYTPARQCHTKRWYAC